MMPSLPSFLMQPNILPCYSGYQLISNLTSIVHVHMCTYNENKDMAICYIAATFAFKIQTNQAFIG